MWISLSMDYFWTSLKFFAPLCKFYKLGKAASLAGTSCTFHDSACADVTLSVIRITFPPITELPLPKITHNHHPEPQ